MSETFIVVELWSKNVFFIVITKKVIFPEMLIVVWIWQQFLIRPKNDALIGITNKPHKKDYFAKNIDSFRVKAKKRFSHSDHKKVLEMRV